VRILAIRGADLASLAGPFEVDLADGVLADASLFAIHGPTGAGKSTLLDAMCLALFDRTPRLEGGGVQVGRATVEEKDRVSSGDPRSLLRHGAGEGHAEVDFVGRGGNRYRARWHVRRARRKAGGRLQKVDWSLEPLDGRGERAAAKKKEVGPAIEAALGLTYDQFCRSVLLPQGAFARFLQAPEKERAELLERVTGTEIYRKISQAAYLRRGEADRTLADAETALGAVARLPEEERAALEAEQQRAGTERGRLVSRRAALTRLRTAGATLEKRRREEAEASEEATERGREAEVRRAALEEARAAGVAAGAALEELLAGQAGARADLARARQLDQDLATHRERLAARERALAERTEAVRSATERREAATATVLAATEREGVARGWLEENTELEAIAEDFSVLRLGLEQLAALPGMREGVARAQEVVEAREAARSAAEAEDGAATEVLVEAQDRRDAARRAREEAPDPGPDLTRLRALRDLHRAVSEATRRAFEAEEAAVAAEVEAREAEARAVALEQEAQVARARADEAGEGVARTRSALELDERRGDLVDGQPCPLCGSEEHPYARHGGPGAQVLAEQEARAQELAGAARELEAQVAQERARAEQATRSASLARERQARAQGEREEPARAWLEEERPVVLPEDPVDPAVEGALDTWEAELEERREGLASLRREADEAQARFEELRGTREKTRDALAEAARLRQEAEAERVRLQEELDGRELEAERLHTRLAEELGESLAARSRSEPGTLAQELSESLAVRGARQEELRAATRDRELAAAEQQRATREAEEATPLRDRAAEEHAQAKVALEEAEERRAGVLEGRDADAVEAELERGAEERRRVHKEAEVEVTAAAEVEAVARTRHEEARARAEAAGKERERAEGELAEASEAAKPDPELSPEAEEAALDQAVRSLDEEAGARRERLEQDAAAARLQAEMEAQLEPLRVEARRWGQLNDLIGSADGAKFRTFAQGLTLDRLLAEANHHLRELAPRFRLDRVPGHALALQVVDRDLGDEVRAVQGLSGGETFLVSLALALGLSGLAAERTPIESLFVDEGFGTLDPASLDRAVEVLEGLEASGRQVGVISHVAGLAERIGAAVAVERLGAGRSRIRVLGPRVTLGP
jgi:exonuclease SbcC